MPFLSLGISPSLVRAACELGFVTPTPIQLAAIPAVLRGADVLGLAQTGSGKTAAYVLPLLQSLQGAATTSPRRVRALILVPTRELAAQVGEAHQAVQQVVVGELRRRQVDRVAADEGVHIAVLKLEPDRQPTLRRLESDARVFRAHAE